MSDHLQPQPYLGHALKCKRLPLVGLCALLVAGACQAQSYPLKPPEVTAWLAASNHTLDQLRGGFDFGAGLVVSFGISRTVYINDQLVTSTTFQLSDITKLTPTQASALSQQLSTQGQVVQNGPGNTVDPAAITVPLATYIQNTLSNQAIRTQTVIQASTNGLSTLRNLNLQATINDAVANAIGNR
jgi:hypothetical protein